MKTSLTIPTPIWHSLNGINRKMPGIITLILFLSLPLIMCGQTDTVRLKARTPKHYFSVNPLNILLFQQIGITYEFKPGMMGYGITAGYIYPNKQEYSNWFIAGPTSYGSLGYYSGLFVEPQVNIYIKKLKNPKHGGMIYIAVKGIYKYMHLDSVGRIAWDTHSDDYYWIYRKQLDNVNIFGGFVDFGFRFVARHFFFDVNLGPGIMSINHKMIIAGQASGPYPIQEINPPHYEELHQTYATINFTLTFGVAF